MPESNPHPFMASATNLTNAEISEHINQMAPKLMRLFKDKSALATSESAAAPQALFTTIQALVNNPQAADDTPLSLEQLNYNYDLLSTGNCIKRHFLISPPANCTEQDKASLALTAVIHLNAIVDGFKLSADTENTNSSPQRRSATPQIREVHHYHGCRSNFWRDMMFYQMIFGNNNQGSNYPSQTSSTGNNSQEDKNKVPWQGILLATCMVVGALATAGYDVMQTYHRFDEMVHGEDIVGNSAKLAITAFSAWQGYLIGTMIGASCFLSPLLGGICLAIIAASAGMAASKWLVGKFYEQREHKSASATDPRFCLTDKEQEKLISQGLNPDIVKEILRECAIAIENEPTNGLVFWQNPHQEIISIARKVKLGKTHEIVCMNVTHTQKSGEKITLTKEFDLKTTYTGTASVDFDVDSDSDDDFSFGKTTLQPPSAPPYYDDQTFYQSAPYQQHKEPLQQSNDIPVVQAYLV